MPLRNEKSLIDGVVVSRELFKIVKHVKVIRGAEIDDDKDRSDR